MSDAERPLKICHVFSGPEGGRWVYEQLEALRDWHGCDVTALLGGTEGSTVDLCRKAGIRVTAADFTLRGWKCFFTLPWRIVKLALWMRRERFDVVQSHVMTSTALARPASWLADIPVRMTMVTGPFYMQAPAMAWMEKATAFMETGIIPSCQLTAELYRKAGISERLMMPTLYYGPHEDRFDPDRTTPAGLREEFGLAPGTPLVASVAVFYRRCGRDSFVPPGTRGRFIKGHTDLIEAMHVVRAEFPDAHLMMIGRGWGPSAPETEEELRTFVLAEGLEDEVHFLGWRADCPAIYVDIDVSVQASLNENLGGTIESLLMACPTVATRVGGMTDSVIDGETGLLANPGDPEDLGRAILRLLRDPPAARRMGRAGRALMLSRFTLTTTVPALAALYRKQRQEAPKPWRLGIGLGRLLHAAFLSVTVLGRALFVEMYLRMALPAQAAAIKRRFGRAAGALLRPAGPLPPRRT